MKDFESFKLDLVRAEAQIKELHALLAQPDPIDEKGPNGLLEFFQARRDLLGLLARLDLGISKPDAYAHELDLEGYFRADFALGDMKRGEYLLIEFEPADDVVFKRNGNKAKRDWHPRFNGGHAQLVDWFWVVSDVEHSKTLKAKFPNFTNFVAMLVIGRDRDLNPEELKRLEWRSMSTSIHGHGVTFLTFDGLLRRVQEEAETIREYGAAAAAVKV
jgi:hypothetical protein